ncbi:MAG: substrate-binding domain-containing protein [Spirochaetia bacterium]
MDKEKKSGQKDVLTFCLVLSDLAQMDTTTVWYGAWDAAKRLGIRLLCIPGGRLDGSDSDDSHANMLYSLISGDRIDGIIFHSGTIAYHLSIEELKAFRDIYSDIPAVSISMPLPESPTIIADNVFGTREVLTHLIKGHNKKRIAFISGPENHEEAELRLVTYKQVMKKNKLQVDEDIIYYGDFQKASGRAAVAHFIDSNKKEFDAVLAANDEMALGALEELSTRGFHIPMDIAVAGFDNSSESIACIPPLTTVSHSFYNTGKRALELLYDQVQGIDSPPVEILPTELVIRQSCGCLPSEVLNAQAQFSSQGARKKSDQEAIESLKAEQDGIRMQLTRTMRTADSAIPENWNTRFFEAFIENIMNPDNSRVIQTLDVIFRSYHFKEGDAALWQNAISVFREQTLNLLEGTGLYITAENILQQARVFIESFVEQTTNINAVKIDRSRQALNYFGQQIITAFHFQDLTDILENQLPLLDVQGLFICTYTAREDNTKLEANLTFAFKDGKNSITKPELKSFPSHRLLPDDIFNTLGISSLVMLPLYFQNDDIGFVFIQGDPKEGLFYEAMKNQLSSALKGISLIDHLAKAEKTLEQKVILRTSELQKKLKQQKKQGEEIQEYSKKLEALVKERTEELLQSEKMASLGSLVAGLAHEINTPLGICLTSSSYIHERTQDIKTQNANHSMKRSDLEKYLDLGNESTRHVLVNLERVRELIESFKKLSIDQTTEERRLFNVKEYMGYVLLSLRPKLKRTNHQVILDIEENLEIYSYPGLLSQVLTNLILNSLIHGFEYKDTGLVRIRIYVQNNKCFILYYDNGKGIPESIQRKMYEPFFTTKRNLGGTGLGLHITYNIVTQNLNGKISCQSVPDESTEFFIEFPITTSLNNREAISG